MSASKWVNTQYAKCLITKISDLKLKEGQRCSMITCYRDFRSGFNSIGLDTCLTLLKEQVRFSKDIPSNLRLEIIKKSIFKAADEDKLTQGYISESIKFLEREYLENYKNSYILVTKITMIGLDRLRVFRAPSVTIRLRKSLPKKIERYYNYKEAKAIYPEFQGESYCWVVIDVEARCSQSAADLALRELNFWLSQINIILNYGRDRVSFGRPAPINTLRKYHYHALHLASGERAGNFYWYEVSYPSADNILYYSSQVEEVFRKQSQLSRRIKRTNLQGHFVNVLSRYSDSLESNDLQKTFLSLWSILEAITFTLKEKYDITIKRALFIYSKNLRDINEVKLESIRERRNMAIHSGENFDEAEKFVYMLLSVIHDMLHFQLNYFDGKRTVDSLKRLLDMPVNTQDIFDLEGELNRRSIDLKLLKKIKNISSE